MKNLIIKIFFCSTLFLVNSLIASSDFIIVLPYRNYIYEQNLSGFQTTFQYRDKVKEIFLDEVVNIPNILSINPLEAQSSEKPYIIAFGTESVNYARKNWKDSTLIYSMVNSARVLGLEKGNICGYELNFPYKNYFKVVKEINPNAKRVHSLYSSSLGEYEARGGEYQDLENNLLMVHKKISLEDDFTKEISNFMKGADAFLLTDDPIFNDKNFKTISDYCKENKILLLTSHVPLIDAGASVGVVPDYNKIGELTGELANNIVSGEVSCSFGPFKSYYSDFLYVNEKYITESGFVLSEDFKFKVDTFKQVASGIELFNKKMYKSSKNTFERILKKDPGNEIANYYFKKILEKLTHSQVQSLLQEAESLASKKKYAQAKVICKKVSLINPDNQPAKDLYDKLQLAESEDLRNEAAALEKRGNPFLALKKYKDSLTAYPTNTKSRAGIENIKREEQKKFPEYTKRGIDYYNKRKYKEAIDIFENILLIDPNHQNSIEYLRLSKVKNEAITKIINCSKQNTDECKLLKK